MWGGGQGCSVYHRPQLEHHPVGDRSAGPIDGDSWRMQYLLKLLEARGQAHYKGDDVAELTELIDSLCTS